MDASNPTVNISFSLMDDSVFEPIMTLFANLRFSVDAHPHVILDPASAEVIILDDDGKSIISDSNLLDSIVELSEKNGEDGGGKGGGGLRERKRIVMK